MNKKLIISLIIVAQITMLSGCGSLFRSNSYEKTYRGFHLSTEFITDSAAWKAPVLAIATAIFLPVDLVVDTLLYPIDKANSLKKDD